MMDIAPIVRTNARERESMTRKRITKVEWYRIGGFRNSRCFRIHNGRCWTYWLELDWYIPMETWKPPRD